MRRHLDRVAIDHILMFSLILPCHYNSSVHSLLEYVNRICNTDDFNKVMLCTHYVQLYLLVVLLIFKSKIVLVSLAAASILWFTCAHCVLSGNRKLIF